jgi:hypothetical protein
MTAGGKVAVEDAGAVEEKAVRIRATFRIIDLLRTTHPPTSGRLPTKTKSGQLKC